MTNLLQAADVGWFGPFKKLLKKRWDDWFINDVHSFTVGNNMRSPGYLLCCNWIQEIWSTYESEEIRKSFRYCGIHLHMNAEIPGEIAVDTSQLHSVLRTMIESGALIQNHLDTDVELQDAELLMPAIDQDLFEDDIDEENVVHEEIADELEEKLMEDDRISSNQQALQEVETELEAFENRNGK